MKEIMLKVKSSSIRALWKMEKSGSTDREDVNTAIPKNQFRSKFTWGCYEASKSYLSIALLLLVGVLLLALYWIDSLVNSRCTESTLQSTSDRFVNFMIVLVLCPFLTFVFGTIKRDESVERLVSKNAVLMAEAVSEILSSNHSSLALKWDNVAAKLNRDFNVTGKWKTPCCFFDGVLCESLFRRYVLKPIIKDNIEDNIEDENSVLRDTADRYQQRIIDQFEQAKKEPLLLADETLPRDFYWNRPIWRFVVLLTKNKFLGTLLGLSILFVLSARIKIINLVKLLSWVIPVLFDEPLNLSGPSETTTNNRIRFLATIVNVAPGDDIDRWDKVAMLMNAYFKQTRSPGSFFDGKDCLRYFNTYLKPLTNKITQDDIATYELVPLVSDCLIPNSST